MRQQVPIEVREVADQLARARRIDAYGGTQHVERIEQEVRVEAATQRLERRLVGRGLGLHQRNRSLLALHDHAGDFHEQGDARSVDQELHQVRRPRRQVALRVPDQHQAEAHHREVEHLHADGVKNARDRGTHWASAVATTAATTAS